MNILKKFSAWLFVMVFILGTAFISQVSAQEEPYFYDTFDDGVIDTDLWEVTGGPVAEYDGKIVLSTEGNITALNKNLVGMWFSARGFQNIVLGESVNNLLGTKTPTNDIVTVGIAYSIQPSDNPENPPVIYNYVFCQWYEDGIIDEQHLHHVTLQPADWGRSYVFGLEYTNQGSILVWVNGQVVYSFSVPGVDIAYSQGGADFWYLADSVEAYGGGDVSAEIDWAKAKDVKICDFSSEPDIEKCFGGIGSQCEGDAPGIYFHKDENTCLVQGWASVGSSLHDMCCFENDNNGYWCEGITTIVKIHNCFREFNLAEKDVLCGRSGRIWPYTFGPYFSGGPGDDTVQYLRAPVGAKVHPKFEHFCQSGKCQVNAKGKMIKKGKGNCKYCECQ